MKKIPLTKEAVAFVDDEDFEWINQWKWYYNGGYARRLSLKKLGPRKVVWMHREIMKTPAGLETDHIDGNKLNNQRSNLRICTTSQNQFNRDKTVFNKSGFKGVSKQDGKWRAVIYISGHKISLGCFDDPEDAGRAYDEAAKKYQGDFARIGNPGA